MEFIFLSYLPAISGLCLLSLVTYLNNPKARLNRLFTLFTALIALWQALLLMTDTASTSTAALWSLRGALFVSPAASFCFLLLSDSFPSDRLRVLKRTQILTIGAVTVFFMVLSLTSFLAENVKHSDSGTTLKMTALYGLHTLLLVGTLLGGALLVAFRRKGATIKQRAQIRLFIFGIVAATAIALIPGFVFVALGVENAIAALLTSLSFLVFSIFMWIAITRYQMFHIRSVVARAVAYTISLLLVVFFYVTLIDSIVGSLADSKIAQLVATSISAALAIVLFNSVKIRLDRITNRLFYREGYSSREKLDALTAELVSNYDLKELIAGGTRAVSSALRPQFWSFVVLKPGAPQMFGRALDSAVLRYVELRAAQATAYIQADDLDENNLMRRVGIAVVVPVRAGAGLEGLLVLGPRSSGEIYSRKDLEFLSIAARNIGLAVNNAQNYERVRDFNKTLRAKIAKATKELRLKNDELERLHKTKDDFISMASHQLRPKITASAGFLDLMDKVDEPFSGEQYELLELAKQGMVQMTGIIDDMLDVSRMDLQNSALSKSQTDIQKVLQEEIDILNRTEAKNRIVLKMPEKSPATVGSVDALKVREVIHNLLSNAVQYSKKQVDVQLSTPKKGVLRLLVIDRGIGMTNQEQRRLYEKFYRSNEAKRIRPNGSGIGLYATRLIIEAHGGSMMVRSKRNHGTEIGFEIPL